jgi:hypothetical protein
MHARRPARGFYQTNAGLPFSALIFIKSGFAPDSFISA